LISAKDLFKFPFSHYFVKNDKFLLYFPQFTFAFLKKETAEKSAVS